MKLTSANTQLVVCRDNTDYPVSLQQGAVYVNIPDPAVERDGDLRVIDESGEDYIYDRRRFEFIDI